MSSTHSPNRFSALPPPFLSSSNSLASAKSSFLSFPLPLLHNPIFDNTEYVEEITPSFLHQRPTIPQQPWKFKGSLVRTIQEDPLRPLSSYPPPPLPSVHAEYIRRNPPPLPSLSPPTPSHPPSKIPKSRNCEWSRGGSTNHRVSHYTIQQSFQQSWRQFRGFGGTRSVHSRYLTTGRR